MFLRFCIVNGQEPVPYAEPMLRVERFIVTRLPQDCNRLVDDLVPGRLESVERPIEIG